ncbi:MAG: M20/M25/M40 family metallo-hydrolase [Pseudohongiella sp.]|nr:M20/M25/M40 family metallo-hydrolase [Pseudohongiella sp.]
MKADYLPRPALLKASAVIFSITLLAACSPPATQTETATETVAAANSGSLIEAELHQHIAVLASDEFGGRAPATPGEKLTTDYLQQQFELLGIQPGNGDSYLQSVPVTEITVTNTPTLSLRGGDYIADLSYADEMVVATYQETDSVELVNSEMVFVGYGIVAPERGWDDYAGVDVRGKTVVILVNDPGYATQNPELFNGNAMTWYGRWPYKYAEAARQGAAGALIIHETGAAAYGWDVVRNSWTGSQIVLSNEQSVANNSAVIGWLTQDSARHLFNGAGLNFDELVSAAAQPDFRAVPLKDIRASTSLRNNVRNSSSNNVIAMIAGTERPDETIIYTAHWDHLGTNPDLPGDNIYNGAVDNAAGTAALLSLAREFSQHPEPPKRSIVFLAVTAEESGLLGAQWYTENPVFPLSKTVANINIDAPTVSGPMNDIVVIGYGNSELEDYLREELVNQPGRYVVAEPHPERGSYYRSDHLNFARQGVPALYAKSGQDSAEHGPEWGAAQAQDYVDNRYHSPADEYDPAWDLSGTVLDIELYFAIGHRLSQETLWPNWYEGNEFKAIRDASAAERSE